MTVISIVSLLGTTKALFLRGYETEVKMINTGSYENYDPSS
jgi:hypothetical protein